MKPVLRDFPDRFETERLLIRSPYPGDGAALNEAIRDTWAELRPWMPWAAGDKPSIDDTEALVRTAHGKFLTREDLMLLVFLRDGGVLIGGSGLHRMDWSVPRFEIGYWLRKGFTGRGYMTEAVQGLTEFAFDILGARRIEIQCEATNERSAAIPIRLGYDLEGTLRLHRRHHLTNELGDTMIFSKIRPDQ